MLSRCNNRNVAIYDRYGGRGIKVCKRWEKSFLNFLADMGVKPSPGHSIERKDNDKSYMPGNCIWAMQTAQVRNRSNTRFLTVDGVTKPLGQWAEERGLNYLLVHARLRLGWSEKESIRPVDVKRSLAARRRHKQT
jgi:hypothetical protein